MPLYLSVDSGGSKCAAILYDDALRVLGRGLSGGGNATQASEADVRRNVEACLSQVFSACPRADVDAVFLCYVGAAEVFLDALPRYARARAVTQLSEPVAGLYAGALRTEGIVALSGTGSDVFYLSGRPDDLVVVGGWGPILGDDGSGAWLGQTALRAAVRAFEGWGEPTALCGLVRDHWQCQNREDLIKIVHKHPAPFRKVASATRLLGLAARAGDAVALGILREGGELLARQTLRVIERANPPGEHRVVICCGGAWKTHDSLFDAFRDALKRAVPGIAIQKPWFEPVLAGAGKLLLERGLSPDQARPMLEGAFPDEVITRSL